MSSLTRARSLRKPAGPTALPPPRERPQQQQPPHDPDRNASPSRLPTTKPASRPTSSARTTTAPARSASVRLNRPGSASSNASSTAAAAAAVPKRSASLSKKSTTAAGQGGHTAAAAAPARRDAQRYPPLSSATRPASMVLRPTSAGSAAPASTATRRTTPTHARANSTAVAGTTTTTAARGAAQAPTTAQERKSRSRPPSRDPTASSSAAAAAATTAADPGTPKRRAVSADKPPPATPTARLQQHRPAFSTLQQRFSPAKTSSPKAATSSHTQPRPASPSKLPANVAAAAETARLQTTLLQLHLLHRDSSAVEAEWQASARAKLGARFRGLRDAHRALADREAAAVEADNVAALQTWAPAGTLDEKVRALSDAVSGVWAMSEPGGKYARAVRRFERWVERVLDLEEARDNGTIGLLLNNSSSTNTHRGSISGGGGGVEEALFLPELDPAWADDCAGMARKLEAWQAQLAGDGAGTTTTSLARMLDGARRLVADMLAELAAMEEIRQAARAREEDWIEAVNRDEDEDEGDESRPRAGAVWRAV